MLSEKITVPVNPAALARHDAAERDAAFTFEAFKAQLEALRSRHEGADIGLVVPVSGKVLQVREVGWEGRNVIFVNGLLDGKRASLIIHHTQLQILLVPVTVDTGAPAPVLYLVPKKQ